MPTAAGHDRDSPRRRECRRRLSAVVLSGLAAIVACVLPACQSHKAIYNHNPRTLTSPYDTPRDVIWVVPPIRNESGVAVADELRLTDALIATVQETEGITALPLNRTLAAMRAAGLPEIDAAPEATALARRMNADAVVIASLTAWDPYDPPQLGLTLALYARSESMGVVDVTGLNPRELSMAATDQSPWSRMHDPSKPLSVVALHIDGSNGAIRSRLEKYASGRIDPNSATGWQGYLSVMQRFERFACFHAANELLRHEHERLIADAERLRRLDERQAGDREADAAQLDAIGASRVLMGVEPH
jgi:hypothetical protein